MCVLQASFLVIIVVIIIVISSSSPGPNWETTSATITNYLLRRAWEDGARHHQFRVSWPVLQNATHDWLVNAFFCAQECVVMSSKNILLLNKIALLLTSYYVLAYLVHSFEERGSTLHRRESSIQFTIPDYKKKRIALGALCRCCEVSRKTLISYYARLFLQSVSCLPWKSLMPSPAPPHIICITLSHAPQLQ